MDVDIDFPPSFNGAEFFGWTRGAVVTDGKYTPHVCGVYPQAISVDPFSGLAAIPYNEAEKFGYIKLDMLSLHLYSHFNNREEIEELLDIDPNWDLLLDKNLQTKLFQLAKHGDVLDAIKPRDTETLADVVALIRPGKRNLLKLYQSQPDATRAALYKRSEEFAFKKSHAIAYALVIKLQLHLAEAGLLS